MVFVALENTRRFAVLYPSASVIKFNSTSDGSRVKATVPMTLPDGMTRPSILRVISPTKCLTVCSPLVQMNR